MRVDPQHSEHTFRAVLSWIYTKATPPQEAGDLPALMCAASFYLLPDLHAECLKVARASLSVHNALEWLLFATQHEEEVLKQAAHQYVAANYKLVRSCKSQQSEEQLLGLFVVDPKGALELMDTEAVGSPLTADGRRQRRRLNIDSSGASVST